MTRAPARGMTAGGVGSSALLGVWGIWEAESREDCIEIECLVGREIEMEYGKGESESADFVKRFERHPIFRGRAPGRFPNCFLPSLDPRDLAKKAFGFFGDRSVRFQSDRLPVLSDLIFAASDRINFRPTSKMSHDASWRDSCVSTRHDRWWRWL